MSNKTSEIESILKNTVLINPQIQEDIQNIEGYNDLLAFYFKVFKEEREREEMLRKSRSMKEKEERVNRQPTYNQKLEIEIQKERIKQRYNVEMYGIETLIQ